MLSAATVSVTVVAASTVCDCGWVLITGVLMVYSPTSSMPNHQLPVPACMKRSRTVGWPSAATKRRTSTRIDSTRSSLMRPLTNGINAAETGAPMKLL